MKINTKIDESIMVQVRDKNYPVMISGSGLPIICIGIGNLCQRTLSESFKQHFKVYSTNLYWVKEYALRDPRSLTIAQIVDDIAELGRNLNLTKYFIFGHSAYGIVALEFAKKYPNLVLGVIMSGTPPNCNLSVAVTNELYFEEHADSTRKMIDKQRRAQFAQENVTSLSFSERFLKEYILRDAARYWHIPDFDCSEVWKDIVLDDVVDHFFSKIIPEVDVKRGLEMVTCPVFLAAGESDYDSCPFMWEKIENLPKKMIISRFKNSGHWPHYEEQELFDQRIANWLTPN